MARDGVEMMNLLALLANQINLLDRFNMNLLAGIAIGIITGVLLILLLVRYFPYLFPSFLLPLESLKTSPTDIKNSKENPEPSSVKKQEPSPPAPALSASEVIATINNTLEPHSKRIENSLSAFETLINFAHNQQEKAQVVRENIEYIFNQLSGISQALGELPVKVRDELSNYQRQEEDRKMIQEQSRQEEDKRKAAEILSKKKEELRTDFIKRLNDLSKSSKLIQISTLARHMTNELKTASNGSLQFEKGLPPYLQLASKVEEVKKKLESIDGSSHLALQEANKQMRDEFELLEKLYESLSRYHNETLFIDLLEEAARHPNLFTRTEDLKKLLDLEEVKITPGTEPDPQILDEIEVEATEGYGTRTIISEVLENGYRLKESGTILKKPRVKVRLEG
jgi:hypothetical protein